MQYCQRFTENYYLCGATVGVQGVGEHTVDNFVSMANHQRAAVVMFVSNLEQGATVDLELLQATDAAGTGAKVIAGKAITQITEEDTRVVIEVRTEEMDVDNRFAYLGWNITIGGGAATLAAIGFLGGTNQAAVSTVNWDEIVD